MKKTKVIAGFLSFAFLSLIAFTPVSAKLLENQSPTLKISENKVISKHLDEEDDFTFAYFTGIVKEVNEKGYGLGLRHLIAENEAGNIAHIVISNDTFVLDNAEINIGATVTGFYNANAPMIMIYPPQYSAEVLVVHNEDFNVKVDIFDQDLVSSDNTLKLNITSTTEIVAQDGNIFKNELAKEKLIVIYSSSTKSIPAQTSPQKIIVLSEKKTDIHDDISNVEIIVNDNKIEAPAAYVNKQGIVMVPLRPTSEALGFEVLWNNENRSITLGNDISLSIGVDKYINMQNPQINLGSAPTLVENRTFVPLSFFREVIQMNNAYLFESQIVIDNGEKMN